MSDDSSNLRYRFHSPAVSQTEATRTLSSPFTAEGAGWKLGDPIRSRLAELAGDAPPGGLQQQFLELSAELMAAPAAEADACAARALGRVADALGLELVAVVHFDDGEVIYTDVEIALHPALAAARARWDEARRHLSTLARAGHGAPFGCRPHATLQPVDDVLAWLPAAGRWQSMLSLPLAESGGVVGFALFGSCDEQVWRPALLEGLRPFGELAANALARKMRERLLEGSLRFERLLFDVSATFIQMPVGDIDVELTRSLHRITVFLGLDIGTLLMLVPGTNRLVRTHYYAAHGVPAVPDVVEGLCEWSMRALRAGEPLIVSSAAELPPQADGERAYMAAAGIESLVAIPLRQAERLIGFASFAVVRREVRWNPVVVQRLKLLGQMFANALARKALEETTQGLVDFELLISTLSARFAGLTAQQVEQAIEPALEEIRALFDADQCALFEVFSDRREAYLRYLAHHPAVQPASRQPNYVELFPWTFEEVCRHHRSNPMSQLDDLPPEAAVDRASKQAIGVQSTLDMPVVVNGAVLFVLTLAFNRRRWQWTDEYMQRIHLLALMLANALMRSRAEAALRASEERFRQVVDAAPNGVMMLDADGRIVMVNRQLETIFGYGREQLVGQPTQALLPAWRPVGTLDRFVQEGNAPEPAQLSCRRELTGLRFNGAEIAVEVGFSPLEIDGADYLLASVVDITQRKRTEQALQAARHSLGEAQRIARLGSIEWNRNDGKWTGSEEARRIYGCAPDDIESPMRYVHLDDQCRVMSLIERVLETKAPRYEFECRIVRPDFSEATLRARAELSYSPDDGNPVRVLGTVQDVTEARAADYEVRRLRAQLYHADRVVRASALTASLAHELNQPLAAILSNAQAGLRLMAKGEHDLAEIAAIFTDIVRDDKRAAAVINGLRAMLRQKETDRVALDVEPALEALLMLLHGELIAAKVELLTEFEPGCAVYADRTQFEQVMLNLVLNALEAMREAAALERRLAISASGAPNGMVRIMVVDSGPGIPADKTDSVFDAFWTTKEQGMGMGLAVCRNIVESHGGRIWLEPRSLEGGACFCVELPPPPDVVDARERDG